jgi:hypothetical protein
MTKLRKIRFFTTPSPPTPKFSKHLSYLTICISLSNHILIPKRLLAVKQILELTKIKKNKKTNSLIVDFISQFSLKF